MKIETETEIRASVRLGRVTTLKVLELTRIKSAQKMTSFPKHMPFFPGRLNESPILGGFLIPHRGLRSFWHGR